MKLETDRLVIRDLEEKDAEDIAKNANDPDNYIYTASLPYPYTLENARNWIKECKKEAKKKIEKREKYSFVIELKDTGEVIGSIGIENVNKSHRKAGIGYWIGKEHRKKGYASEAEERILEFAFNELNLNKIKGQCIIENKGSIKLFEKFGFRRIGVEKEELIKNNEGLEIRDLRQDSYMWELLKSDWEKKVKNEV